MALQDSFQPPPLYGRQFVGDARALATESQIDPSIDVQARIEAYIASLMEHAAAVSSENGRLIPYVRGQLGMILISAATGTNSPANEGQNRHDAVIRTLIERLGQSA